MMHMQDCHQGHRWLQHCLCRNEKHEQTSSQDGFRHHSLRDGLVPSSAASWPELVR